VTEHEQGCAACVAEQTQSAVPPGFTWLIGFAAGVRCAIQNAGVELCPAHAVDYERIRRVFGHPQSLIENIPSGEPIPPPVTLECFVTREEFERIKAIAKAAASFEGVEKGVREVLGDEAWERMQKDVVGFSPCEVVPAERFRKVAGAS
jgi:hypothetical protein